jgi:hypothetical protein
MHEIELRELLEVIYRAVCHCKLIDVALYVAHRQLGKPITTTTGPDGVDRVGLDYQTGISAESIQRRIDYVEAQLLRNVRVYMQQ